MPGGLQIGDVLELAVANKPFDVNIALNKLPPQPSENWERDALASVLWLLVWKRIKLSDLPEAFNTLDKIADWYPKQDFCGSEDFARVYGGRNSVSGVAAREAFRRLGHAAGLEFMSRWCKALAGYVALGSGWASGKNVDYTKLQQSIAPEKPQLVVSDPKLGPASEIRGAPCFVLPGDRSFAHNGLGWLTVSGLCALPHLVKGDVEKFLTCRSAPEVFMALVEKGAEIRLCSAEESDVAWSAMQNDLRAIQTIWNEWLPLAPLPKDRFMVVRRLSGVEAARLEGTEAPTAQLDYASWRESDGQQRFMAVNDAYRQDWIRSSVVEHDAAITTWKAYTDNLNEGKYREISCAALPGPIVFAGRFGKGERTILILDGKTYHDPVPQPEPPTPSPIPTPKPKKKGGCSLLIFLALSSLAGAAWALFS